MNDLMQRVLREKAETRKRLINLPIEEKLALMEKMRDRRRLIDASSLRMKLADMPKTETVVISGDGEVLSVLGVERTAWMRLGHHQLPTQPNTHQNSVSLTARLQKRSGQWQMTPLDSPSRPSVSPSQE